MISSGLRLCFLAELGLWRLELKEAWTETHLVFLHRSPTASSSSPSFSHGLRHVKRARVCMSKISDRNRNAKAVRWRLRQPKENTVSESKEHMGRESTMQKGTASDIINPYRRPTANAIDSRHCTNSLNTWSMRINGPSAHRDSEFRILALEELKGRVSLHESKVMQLITNICASQTIAHSRHAKGQSQL